MLAVAWVRNAAGRLPASLVSSAASKAALADTDETAWTILDDRRAFAAGMAAHPSHAEEGAESGAQRAAMLFYKRVDLPEESAHTAPATENLLIESDLWPQLPVGAGGRLDVPPDTQRLFPLTIWFRNSSPFVMELKVSSPIHHA